MRQLEDFDYFCGEIRAFAFPAPPNIPEDWLACDGRIVTVAQYGMLYEVIGNTFGGSPNTLIQLPDLRGRAALGAGVSAAPKDEQFEAIAANGTQLGYMGGTPEVALTSVPVHGHGFSVATANPPFDGAVTAPSATAMLSRPMYAFVNSAANQHSTAPAFANDLTSGIVNTAMIVPSCGVTGGAAAPHENRQPFLALNFCIATYGEMPKPGGRR